jgi:dihydroneopterin aldolase
MWPRHGKLDAMTSRDSITLTGLRVHANHGVYDFEREAGQEFVVDVTAWLDLAPAAASDEVAATLHYGELAVEIADAVRRDPVDLIETVAERVASLVLAHHQTEAVQVTVHKPDAPIEVPFGDVAVTIVRERVAALHAGSQQ